MRLQPSVAPPHPVRAIAMSQTTRSVLVSGLSIAAAMAVLVLLATWGGITWADITGILARSPAWLLPAIALLTGVQIALSALKWKWVLARIRPDIAAEARFGFYFYASAASAFLSQLVTSYISSILVRSWAARRAYGLPIQSGGSTSLFEQIFDAALLVVLAVPTLLTFALGLSASAWLLLTILSLLGGAGALWIGSRLALRGTLPTTRLGLLNRVINAFKAASEAGLFDASVLIRLYAVSALRYTTLLLRAPLVVLGLALPLTTLDVLQGFTIVQATQLLALVPGNLGIQEWSWAGVLVLRGLTPRGRRGLCHRLPTDHVRGHDRHLRHCRSSLPLAPEAPRMTDITVIVVARNEAANIARCMASLAAQTTPAARVILVDDGSTDDTIALAQRALPSVDVIESPTRSIAQNRNVGWRAAETTFVAFLDADCEAPSNWLATLSAAAQRTSADGVGGGNVPPADEGNHYRALAAMLGTFLGSRGSTQGMVPTTERETDHLPGLNVLLRRDALALVGGYDPRFARMGEDADLSARLRDLGCTLVVTPGANVIHRQRPDLSSWARNMRTYGAGRTRLLRRHPNLWSPIFLAPPLMLVLLPLYLPAIALYAAYAALRTGDITLWPRTLALFVATHLPYAWGQIAALFEPAPKRVTLVALKNAGNKGDEAIASCVCARVHQALSEDDGTDLYLAGFGPTGLDVRPVPETQTARDRLILDLLAPAAQSRTTPLSTLVPMALRSLIVFTRFNAIVIAGGQWLHDLSLAKHAIISTMFAVARAAGTQTGVFCVGVGPLKRPISRWLLRRAFGPKSLLVTRDAGSTALLHTCGHPQASTASDPALHLPTAEAPRHADVLISPCAWASFENLYALDSAEIEASLAEWQSVLAELEARGHSIAILPTMNPEDEEFAARIIAGRDIPIIDTHRLTPAEVQGHIATAEHLISMRLHPVIFATNCGVSFVSLNYATKVRAFCEQAGLADRVVELGRKGWAQDVITLLDTAIQDPSGAKAAQAAQRVQVNAAYDRLFSWLNIETNRAPQGGAAAERREA